MLLCMEYATNLHNCPVCCCAAGCVLQYLGDADVVQELEDFGQLDDALNGQLSTSQ